MKQPDELALWLSRYFIDTMKIDYRQTGCDTAETYIIMSGSGMNDDDETVDVEREELLSEVSKYVDFQPSHNQVFVLSAKYDNECRAWWNFVEENEEDLEEYERLKKKFA